MFYNLKTLLKEIYVKIRKALLYPFVTLRQTRVFHGSEIKRILFLRHDRIGDMVLSTAALKALRRSYPGAKVTVLASERNYEILKHNPNIDEVLTYKGVIRFIREIRPRQYDLVIDAFVTHELRQAFMAYLSGGKYRVGFDRAGREIFFNVKGPATSTSKKMVDHVLDLVEAVGAKRMDCEPEVFLTDEEQEWASETLAHKGIDRDELVVAIHPGAYYPSQRWPAERFGELARRILEHHDAKVILLGGRGEDDLLKRVKAVAGKGVQVFSNRGLRELMALLSRCDLLVCNNSGPLHIASALKIPTVSMVGPTVTPLWLPCGERDVVLDKGLSCSPCNRAVCKTHECMEAITVDEVFEVVRSQISWIETKRKRVATVR